jgi:beta-glucosidase
MDKRLYLLMLVMAFIFVGYRVSAEAGSTPAVTGNNKVDNLLIRMTFEEKVSMIHGSTEPKETNQGQAGYLPGVTRLGIPSLRLADGPHGLVTRKPTTGMAGTIGLAAA